MPGHGRVTVGAAGVGGMEWSADATTGLDFWVTAAPAGNRDKAEHGSFFFCNISRSVPRAFAEGVRGLAIDEDPVDGEWCRINFLFS